MIELLTVVAINGRSDGFIDLPTAVLLQYQDINYVRNYNSGGSAGNAVQAGCIAGSFGTLITRKAPPEAKSSRTPTTCYPGNDRHLLPSYP